MATNVDQVFDPSSVTRPGWPRAAPVWLVTADPLSRSQYYLNNIQLNASGIKAAVRVIEITGAEDRADCDRIKRSVAEAAVRIYSLEELAGSSLIRKLLLEYSGTVLVHDHLFVTSGTEPEADNLDSDHLLHLELTAAKKLIFFNERALNDVVRRLAAGAAPEIFLSGMPAAVSRRTDAVPPKDFSIVIIADPGRLEHRAEKILLAVSNLKHQPEIRWLIGDGQTDTAAALATSAGINPGCLRFEPRNPERFFELGQSTSAAVLLSNSPFGDLSPYLELSFAAGLATIVSDFSVGASLPDELVFKVLPGFSEIGEIAGILARLADREMCRRLAPHLQHFAERKFNPNIIAAEFESILFDRHSAAAAITPG